MPFVIVVSFLQRAWADRRRRGGGLPGAAACRRVVLHGCDGMSAVEHIGASAAFASTNRDSRFRIRASQNPIAALFVSLDRNKPAYLLAECANIGVRAAELVLQGRNDLSRKSLINLLRSRVGDRVLDAILGSPAPAWRKMERELMSNQAARERLYQLEEERRHLEALLAGRR